MMKAISFPCSRCGGTGQFGRLGKCFKCHGTGTQATPSAITASGDAPGAMAKFDKMTADFDAREAASVRRYLHQAGSL